MAFVQNKILSLFLLILAMVSIAQGKCFDQSNSDKVKEFPIIVRGVVTNYTEKAGNTSYEKEISFDVTVVLALKGAVNSDKLKVS